MQYLQTREAVSSSAGRRVDDGRLRRFHDNAGGVQTLNLNVGCMGPDSMFFFMREGPDSSMLHSVGCTGVELFTTWLINRVS